MPVKYRGETLSCQSKMKRTLILASQSPRRRALLESLGFEFEQDVSMNFQEKSPADEDPFSLVLENAKGKAMDVAERHPDSIIIGVDTLGHCNGEILEKPKDKSDAFRMLKLLQGRSHEILTGLFVLDSKNGQSESCVEKTTVHFLPLSDEEINRYILTGEPMDKAAAYAVQGIGSLFINRLEGDYFSVMGLPISRLFSILKQFDINLLFEVK